MMRPRRWPLFSALALIPSAAHASDFSGVVTIVFGIPGLLVATVVASAFLLAEPSRVQKASAAVLFLPVLAAAAWVFVGDTAPMMQRGLPDDLLISAAYVLLLLVLAALVARILLRPLAPEARGRTE